MTYVCSVTADRRCRIDRLKADQLEPHPINPLVALILISTPAGRLSLFSASIVLAVAWTMSISRLCVRISNCCRAFLSTCGLREHRVPLDPRRQRNRPVHFRVGPLGRIDDLRRALIEHRVIVGLHPDANDFPRGSHD